MKYPKIFISFFICLFIGFPGYSQHHEHAHSRNEIGIGGGALYSPDHDVWGGGVHLHYFRSLGVHSHWSLGAGVEQAWADGSHFTVGVGAKYRLIERLELGIMPGVTFFKHDDAHASSEHDSDHDYAFSVHFEIVYELLHFGSFHLGPAVDYSLSKDDTHFMMGVHAAYCF